jgi:hypothetical protein
MSLHQMRTYELDDSPHFELVYFVLVQRLEAIPSFLNAKFSILMYIDHEKSFIQLLFHNIYINSCEKRFLK